LFIKWLNDLLGITKLIICSLLFESNNLTSLLNCLVFALYVSIVLLKQNLYEETGLLMWKANALLCWVLFCSRFILYSPWPCGKGYMRTGMVHYVKVRAPADSFSHMDIVLAPPMLIGRFELNCLTVDIVWYLLIFAFVNYRNNARILFLLFLFRANLVANVYCMISKYHINNQKVCDVQVSHGKGNLHIVIQHKFEKTRLYFMWLGADICVIIDLAMSRVHCYHTCTDINIKKFSKLKKSI